MSGVKGRKWILKSHFVGLPKREDLEIVEEELPALKDGEFLCEAVWLSVDPYMRTFSNDLPLGSVMLGEQVAKVIQSKNSKYNVGDVVTATFGWVSHAICDDTKTTELRLFKVDTSIVPVDRLSYALGVLGMPGATAYLGFLEVCKPKAGETLVITGAAGAVGSLVGQIAKIKGCRVVGFAGTDSKVEFLKSVGFDEAINYKKMSSLEEALKEACPNGIDLFYDNVGGEFHNTVVKSMNTFGRIVLGGAISEYNVEPDKLKVSTVCMKIINYRLKLQGIFIYDWADQWSQAFKQNRAWIDEGKLKVSEHIVEGFGNMFEAFVGLFKGENIGKAVVKA